MKKEKKIFLGAVQQHIKQPLCNGQLLVHSSLVAFSIHLSKQHGLSLFFFSFISASVASFVVFFGSQLIKSGLHSEYAKSVCT